MSIFPTPEDLTLSTDTTTTTDYSEERGSIGDYYKRARMGQDFDRMASGRSGEEDLELGMRMETGQCHRDEEIEVEMETDERVVGHMVVDLADFGSAGQCQEP